jgi:hypothetical protein
MTYLNKTIDIESNIVDILELSKNQVAIKIKNPIFDIHNAYGVPFQPILYSFGVDETIQENVVVFPIIPQYFHNFFELFGKILLLKKTGEQFKVVLVYPSKNKEDNIFKEIIRDHPEANTNAFHWKEFLEYFKIDFLCLDPDELKAKRFLNTYLFYDNKGHTAHDPIFFYNETKYTLSTFLKVPYPEIVFENVNAIKEKIINYEMDNLKIFISRKKAVDRKYYHEEELELKMQELGYSIILLEDLPLIDQIKIIQQSSHIVCLYGSALVNTSLCSTSKIFAINTTKDYFVGTYEYLYDQYKIDYTVLDIDNNYSVDDIMINIQEWGKK